MTLLKESTSEPDVRTIDGGSVLLFLLLTDQARAWVEEHVSEDRQMLGMGLAVETLYAAALADGMRTDGLVVEHVDLCFTDQGRTDDCVTTNDDQVQVVLTTPCDRPTTDRYDLGWLFTCWAWEAGYRDWNTALRALARTLRSLERGGLIERRRIVRPGRRTHHGFVLTDDGREALAALSGDWIDEVRP
jgi:hypothetical protein